MKPAPTIAHFAGDVPVGVLVAAAADGLRAMGRPSLSELITVATLGDVFAAMGDAKTLECGYHAAGLTKAPWDWAGSARQVGLLLARAGAILASERERGVG